MNDRSVLSRRTAVLLARSCVLAALSVVAAVLLAPPARSAEKPDEKPSLIRWQPWSDAAFAQAKRENKLVILDLEAVWCHWCHVMDDQTYHDPKVAQLINDHFVAIRVDQDSRPDVSKQYENWGWPATILFGPDGRELVKRAGYIPPGPMESMLRATIDDPTPGPSVTQSGPSDESAAPPSDLVKALRERNVEMFDQKEGAWGFVHKYMDPPSTEYAMEMGRKGDADLEAMARKTLDGMLNLVDPAWGGVYQYSTGGVWTEPHFEKIMSYNADDMRIYALAYRLYGDEKYLKAAQSIRGFLDRFLKSRKNGAFYTSMDADLVQGEHSADYFALSDAERVKKGVPRVDMHQYARENGWAIAALVDLYAATGDRAILDEARRAAQWIKKNRGLPGGGFSHDARDVSGPYLGDSLAMGRAFLALYAGDGNRLWLKDAEAAAGFIGDHFSTSSDGLLPYAVSGASPLKPAPDRDENVDAARFFNLLYHYTGKKPYHETALASFRFLSGVDVSEQGLPGPILLVEREVNSDPIHLTVVGPKKDPVALKLQQAALFFPSGYKRVEWLDRKEGPLPNSDVEYPELDRPAAFSCGGGRCSRPAFTPEDLTARAKAL